MEKKLLSVILINGFWGVLNLIWIISDGITIWNFIFMGTNIMIIYLIYRDLSSCIIGILTYPIGLFIPISANKGGFHDLFDVRHRSLEYIPFNRTGYLNTLPIKSIAALGTSQQKKMVILEITELIKQGVNISENTAILRKLLEDPHPDVGLYASESLDEIEDHYVEEIAKLEFSTEPEDIVKFCNNVLNLLETNIVVGELQKYYRKIILEKVRYIKEEFPEDYYVTLYRTTSDINALRKGFEETRSYDILRMLFAEDLRKKNFKEAKQIIKDFPEILKEYSQGL